MSNYIKMVDCSEEELMHYGVLGMKWHHHKAKGYYNKMMRYKNSAQVKGQDAVRMIGQPGENRKQTKALLKGSQKDLVKANKYLQKHNKYIDKMNAGFDENRDKVMKSKKYVQLEQQKKYAEDAKAAYKKSLDRGDYDEVDKATYDKAYKPVYDKTYKEEYKRLTDEARKMGWLDDDMDKLNKIDAAEYAHEMGEQAAFDQKGIYKPNMDRYNSMVSTQDKEISNAQNKQDKMLNKVEKKRKKYVSFVY